jgi:KUP system potassium uptake protein
VKTCLMINYLGQAAWLLHEGGTTLDGRNPFFEMMPHWFVLPGILIATAAAIIASQALISGSYTLINEAMNLNFWPRVLVRQPTDLKRTKFYISERKILYCGWDVWALYCISVSSETYGKQHTDFLSPSL